MSVTSLSPYRLATVEDAPAIGAFQARAWRENYAGILPSWVIDGFSAEERIAAWRQILRRPSFHDNAFVILSTDATGIAAMGAASGQRVARLRALGFTAQIEALFVRGDLQNNGLGRGILRRLFIELGARGHHAVSHWLMCENTRGAAFLEAAGAHRITLADTGQAESPDMAYGWRDIGRPDSLSWHDPRGKLTPCARQRATSRSLAMGRATDLGSDLRRRSDPQSDPRSGPRPGPGSGQDRH